MRANGSTMSKQEQTKSAVLVPTNAPQPAPSEGISCSNQDRQTRRLVGVILALGGMGIFVDYLK